MRIIAFAAVLLGASAIQLRHADQDAKLQWGVNEIKKRTAKHEEACKDRYTKTMTSLIDADVAGAAGDVLVIGANDGHSFDPAWTNFQLWDKLPHSNKVMVEASPPVFKKLEGNLKQTPNVTFVNKGVTGLLDAGSPYMTIHCWNTDSIDNKVSLPQEVRPFQDYWGATCDTNREFLLSSSHVFDTKEFKVLEGSTKTNIETQVMKHIQSHSVDLVTPMELIKENHLQNTQYVQVDVESSTLNVVEHLPLGQDGFLPKAILFEGQEDSLKNERINALLTDHGYGVCVFYEKGGNILATLGDADVPLDLD